MAYIVRDRGLLFKRVIRQTHKERNLCRLLIHTHLLEKAVGTQHLSVIGGKQNQAVIVNILLLQLVYELSYTVIQKGNKPQIGSPAFRPLCFCVMGSQSAGDIIELKGRLMGIPVSYIFRERNLLRPVSGKPGIRDLQGRMGGQEHGA